MPWGWIIAAFVAGWLLMPWVLAVVGAKKKQQGAAA